MQQNLNFNQAKTDSASSEPFPIAIEDELDNVRFKISHHPHITVNSEICSKCSGRACLVVCPAKLFVETANGDVIFSYENCFECGACCLVCNQEGAINWNYPTGGYGVAFVFS